MTAATFYTLVIFVFYPTPLPTTAVPTGQYGAIATVPGYADLESCRAAQIELMRSAGVMRATGLQAICIPGPSP